MPTWTPSSARELGKRRLERIPVQETAPDRSLGDRAAWTPDLVSIPQKAWQTAVKRFKALKPLIEMTPAERTLEKVQKVAAVVRKHPATSIPNGQNTRTARESEICDDGQFA